MAKQGEEEREAPRRDLAPSRPSRMWTEMDRVFDEFRRDVEEFFGRPRKWLPGGLALPVRRPAVNIEDTGKSLVVTAEMPGITKEDLNLDVTDDAIEIRAESKKESEERRGAYAYRERSATAFHRYLTLPTAVDPNGAEAKLENGILRIELPKRVPTRSRKVQVE